MSDEYCKVTEGWFIPSNLEDILMIMRKYPNGKFEEKFGKVVYAFDAVVECPGHNAVIQLEISPTETNNTKETK